VAGCQRLQGFWRERELTQGTFKEIGIGHTKSEVLVGLRKMQVKNVQVASSRDRTISKPADLHFLRGAEKIVVGAGAAVIEFRGDQVSRVHVAPARQFGRWRDLLQATRTRDEAFHGLRQILEEYPRVQAQSVVPGVDRVRLDSLDLNAMRLVERYDIWHAPFEDAQGWWGLRLHFDGDKLRTIVYSYSPFEGP
jgi:hypothetical protein